MPRLLKVAEGPVTFIAAIPIARMEDDDEQPINETAEEPAEERPREPNWPGAEPLQAAFLSALVFHAGQHGKAAKSARMARQTHYRWMRTDERYRKLHERAMAHVTEVLEDEAIRRAKEGIKKGIYYQGEECGKEILYSDSLMMFLLRGAAPDKYRDRTEVRGEVDVRHRFDGTMEELLALYRRVTMKEGVAE